MEGSVPVDGNIRLLSFRQNPEAKGTSQVSGKLKRIDILAETKMPQTRGPSESRGGEATPWTQPLFNLFWTDQAPNWPTKSNAKVCFEEMPPVFEEHSSTKISRRQSLRIDETPEDNDSIDCLSGMDTEVPAREICTETSAFDVDTLGRNENDHLTGLVESCFAPNEERQMDELELDNTSREDEVISDALESHEKSEKLCMRHEEDLRGAIEAVRVASLYASIAKEAEAFRRKCVRSDVTAQ